MTGLRRLRAAPGGPGRARPGPGTEFRLGAERHSVSDYLDGIADAGFRRIEWQELAGDDGLVRQVPAAARYRGHPLLLHVRAERGT